MKFLFGFVLLVASAGGLCLISASINAGESVPIWWLASSVAGVAIGVTEIDRER